MACSARQTKMRAPYPEGRTTPLPARSAPHATHPSALRVTVGGRLTRGCARYGELRYGAEKSQERERALAITDHLIAIIPAQPLPITAGEIRLDLERTGMMIGNYDYCGSRPMP